MEFEVTPTPTVKSGHLPYELDSSPFVSPYAEQLGLLEVGLLCALLSTPSVLVL